MSRRLSGPPDSDPFNVSRLFEETYPLVIPRWQRDYSWEPEVQVKVFLEDLSEFFEEARNVRHRYYLLGQVIVVGNDADEFEVVDGQQRMTTLFLLLTALHNGLSNRFDPQDTSEATAFTSLHKCISDDSSRVRLQSPFQEGTQVLQHLFSSQGSNPNVLGSLSRTQQNLVAVYGYIEDWISSNLQTKEEVIDFSKLVLQKVYLTRLVIDDIPVALDYFEKMNRRGLPLAAADLLKNYLFAQVPEENYEDLTRQWNLMQKELDQVSRKSIGNTEQFVKSWAVSISGTKLTGSEQLLKFWKSELDDSSKIEKFKGDLKPRGELFKSIANFKNPKDSEKLIVEAGKHFNGSQFISVLMAGHGLVNFDYLADLVDRRFVAYVYAKERTATFDSVMASWSKKVLSLEPTATCEEILNVSREASGFTIDGLDSMIRSGIETLSYSKKSHAKRLRYVLALVSRSLDSEARTGDWGKPITEYLTTVRGSTPGMDMDHILGQTYLGNESQESQRIFNSVGALTLVFSSDHRQDTRTRPIEKLNMYKRSRYVFTQSLAPIDGGESGSVRTVINQIRTELPVDLANWNEEIVQDRTKFIVDTFLKAITYKELM
jgi:uncharacterized protein with ParB-like and HNH nuclease domain